MLAWCQSCNLCGKPWLKCASSRCFGYKDEVHARYMSVLILLWNTRKLRFLFILLERQILLTGQIERQTKSSNKEHIHKKIQIQNENLRESNQVIELKYDLFVIYRYEEDFTCIMHCRRIGVLSKMRSLHAFQGDSQYNSLVAV